MADILLFNDVNVSWRTDDIRYKKAVVSNASDTRKLIGYF